MRELPEGWAWRWTLGEVLSLSGDRLCPQTDAKQNRLPSTITIGGTFLGSEQSLGRDLNDVLGASDHSDLAFPSSTVKGSTAFKSSDQSGLPGFCLASPCTDSFNRQVPTYGTSTVWLRALMDLNQRIPLAPLPEQHRIVAKIESLFAKLDEGVAALQRAQANLERYRASVLKAAVDGRLTEQWHRENPSDETGAELLRRILAERRKRWEEEQLANFEAKGRKPPRNWKAKYKEPVEPDTRNLRELPDGWCWATVDQLGRVIGGLTKNPARRNLSLRLPYLRVANVYADEMRLDDIRTIGVTKAELDRVSLLPGDLLIVEGNGSADQIGRVALWDGTIKPCVHQNHLIKVRFGRYIRPRWPLMWLLSPAGRSTVLHRASSTSGLHTLSLSKVRSLPIPLPPRLEQAEAERAASTLRDATQIVEGGLGAGTIRADALRQSILKRAFEGRLVPQDPADEPASVLFDRIRAQRRVRS